MTAPARHRFCACALALLSVLFSAQAATVTTLNDSGPGSLRDLVSAAVAGDTIQFAVTGTISLTTGQILINKNLNIAGPGAASLNIRQPASSRLFTVATGTVVSISAVKLSDGHINDHGGGILNNGDLTVSHCSFFTNDAGQSGSGGGICNFGNLVVSDCTFYANTARQGGAICNFGQVSVRNCTLNANQATVYGGGVYNGFQPAEVVNCTIIGNSSAIGSGGGGGICNKGSASAANITVSSCTFFKNSALSGAQGNNLFNDGSGGSAQLTLRSSILVNQSFNNDLANSGGTFASQGFNVCADTGNGFLTGPSDQINTDPGLDPYGLHDNGGPTQTIALMDGSPAIDHGQSFGLTSDQRGGLRPYDHPFYPNGPGTDGTDVGAFEGAPDVIQKGAPQFSVNTLTDGDDGICGVVNCTLREAINRANLVTGPDTILFLAGGTITLDPALGELLVNDSLTLAGFGARTSVISGGGQVPVIAFGNGASVLIGLTIRDGRFAPPAGFALGAGLYLNGGTLTVHDCSFLNNQSIGGSNGRTGEGAGIYNSFGTLTLNRCTIAGNNATGGHGGNTNSAAAAGDGGAAQGAGLFNASGATSILNNCTIANNTAQGGPGGDNSGGPGGIGGAADGAGLFNDGTVVLTACTVAGNIASGGNGGSGLGGTHAEGGQETGGLKANSGSTRLGNTLVALNTGSFGPDVTGTFASQGFNLIGKGDSGSGFNGMGDSVGNNGSPINPNLGPLQDNGGNTDTMALLNGSPAIDRGNSFGLTTDQRSQSRPNDHPLIANVPGGNGSDIGAFEFGAVLLVNTLDDHSDGTCNTVDCTLREAIAAANTQPGEQFIKFDPALTASQPGIIQLTGALPALASEIYLQGPGADRLTVRRNTGGDYRIFTVGNSTASGPFVSIRGLTIANGKVGNGSALETAAGILVDRSILNLQYCALTGNLANSFGGAVFITQRSEPSAILNCTFSGNTASGSGGGAVAISSASAVLRNCTFSGNSAVNGGAIWIDQAVGSSIVPEVPIESCTFSGNNASNHGSDLSKANGSVHFLNCILNDSANSTLHSFTTSPTSDGFNLASDNGGGYLTSPTDMTNVNPQLGPLANNGGPTQTCALLSNSPAINRGGNGWPADQRDYPRVGLTDIGAFEFNSFAVRITAIQRFSDGSVQLDGQGVVNGTFSVLASPDLVSFNFAAVGLTTSDSFGNWHYLDTASVGLTKQFYKATYP